MQMRIAYGQILTYNQKKNEKLSKEIRKSKERTNNTKNKMLKRTTN